MRFKTELWITFVHHVVVLYYQATICYWLWLCFWFLLCAILFLFFFPTTFRKQIKKNQILFFIMENFSGCLYQVFCEGFKSIKVVMIRLHCYLNGRVFCVSLQYNLFHEGIQKSELCKPLSPVGIDSLMNNLLSISLTILYNYFKFHSDWWVLNVGDSCVKPGRNIHEYDCEQFSFIYLLFGAASIHLLGNIYTYELEVT